MMVSLSKLETRRINPPQINAAFIGWPVAQVQTAAVSFVHEYKYMFALKLVIPFILIDSH